MKNISYKISHTVILTAFFLSTIPCLSQTLKISDIPVKSFPTDVKQLYNQADSLILPTADFLSIFVQTQNLHEYYNDPPKTYKIILRSKIGNNDFYFIKYSGKVLMRRGPSEGILLCCFNPMFKFPQMIEIYAKIPSLFAGSLVEFKFDEENNTLTVLSCSTQGELVGYCISIYSIKKEGLKMQSFVNHLPFEEMVQQKDWLRGMGFYTGEN